MKLFTCSKCQLVVNFEDATCTRCGSALAFLPDRGVVAALEPVPPGAAKEASGAPPVFVALGVDRGRARYRPCGNQIDHGACNWAVPADDPDRFCRACRLNEIIPDLSDPEAKPAWLKLETAKRRTVYTLLALGLPVEPRAKHPGGMGFAFKKDVPGQEKVMIGHEQGLITINIAEADSPFREKTRLELGEPYRTLLGHFRHEIGHYYWDQLVAGSRFLEPFRAKFGDERASYDDAVTVHYRDGAPKDWRDRFISSYASMHPWEDWAESWAHYLHMVDTLETARSFGLALQPKGEGGAKPDDLAIKARRVSMGDIDDMLGAFPALTIALNSLNRSLGLPDPYPFAPPAPAIEKIRFVHEVIDGTDANAVLKKAAAPAATPPTSVGAAPAA